MEIKTKFNVGDEVFTLEGNRITQRVINAIQIQIHPYNTGYDSTNRMAIEYYFMQSKHISFPISQDDLRKDNIMLRYEAHIFSTKDELLKSL